MAVIGKQYIVPEVRNIYASNKIKYKQLCQDETNSMSITDLYISFHKYFQLQIIYLKIYITPSIEVPNILIPLQIKEIMTAVTKASLAI